MAVCCVILRRQQIYTVIQAVYKAVYNTVYIYIYIYDTLSIVLCNYLKSKTLNILFDDAFNSVNKNLHVILTCSLLIYKSVF